MIAAELYDRVAARLPEEEDETAEALEPETVTRTVLTAVAERLSPEAAAELGAELPEQLGHILLRAEGDGALDRDELIEALAARLDVDDETAEAATRAVLMSVRELLEPVVSIAQVLESLPPDLAHLMGG